ncbi:MAG: methyltransferase domain-containing protein [Isosphaeraceae bacterium]|nr:methyltransferase domain-containing protein [Isosphaeraceae bacterium]
MTSTDVSHPVDGTRAGLLSRIARVLACPDCKGPIDVEAATAEAALACPHCGPKGRTRNGQFLLGGFEREDIEADWLNRRKEKAKKKLGRLYPLAIRALSPVYGADVVEHFLRSFDSERDLVADLGCGTTGHDERAVCVDGADYPNVHVVASLEELPFRDDSLAGIISMAVLEHVADPAAHVREMLRVLRPGGRVLCFVPFIQGFHASPRDYQRLTAEGLRQLFAEFEEIETRVAGGPTSGLLWILQEWLALTLSCGSRRLYRLLLPLMWVLSPLKYFDILLASHPDATVIASGHAIEARKPFAR